MHRWAEYKLNSITRISPDTLETRDVNMYLFIEVTADAMDAIRIEHPAIMARIGLGATIRVTINGCNEFVYRHQG